MKLRRTYVEDHLPEQTDTAANEKGVQAVFETTVFRRDRFDVTVIFLVVLLYFHRDNSFRYNLRREKQNLPGAAECFSDGSRGNYIREPCPHAQTAG